MQRGIALGLFDQRVALLRREDLGAIGALCELRHSLGRVVARPFHCFAIVNKLLKTATYRFAVLGVRLNVLAARPS